MEEGFSNNIWTWKQDKAFEKGLVMFPEKCEERWDKISALIPGYKSPEQVRLHYLKFLDDIAALEAGTLTNHIPGSPTNNSAYPILESSLNNETESSTRTGKEKEYKKGRPWTELEHKNFLLGMEKHGKGEWKTIATDFVKTRTPSQVASHGQKFFKRKDKNQKREKRWSIFDDNGNKNKEVINIDDDDEDEAQLKVNDGASFFDTPSSNEKWSLYDIIAPCFGQPRLDEVNSANGSTKSSTPNPDEKWSISDIIPPPSNDQAQSESYYANGNTSYAPLASPNEGWSLFDITTPNVQGQPANGNTKNATPCLDEKAGLSEITTPNVLGQYEANEIWSISSSTTPNGQGQPEIYDANGITSYAVLPTPDERWNHHYDIVPPNDQGQQPENNDVNGKTKRATPSPNETCSIINSTTPNVQGQEAMIHDANGDAKRAKLVPHEKWSLSDITTPNDLGQSKINDVNGNTKHAIPGTNDQCNILNIATPNNDQGPSKINDANGNTTHAKLVPHEKWSRIDITAPTDPGSSKINDANGNTKHGKLVPHEKWTRFDISNHATPSTNERWSILNNTTSNGITSYATPTPNERWGLCNIIAPHDQTQVKINDAIINGYAKITNYVAPMPPNGSWRLNHTFPPSVQALPKIKPRRNGRWGLYNTIPPNVQAQPKITNYPKRKRPYKRRSLYDMTGSNAQGQNKTNDVNGNTNHATPKPDRRRSLFGIIPPKDQAQLKMTNVINGNTSYATPRPNESWGLFNAIPSNDHAQPKINFTSDNTFYATPGSSETWSLFDIVPSDVQAQPKTNEANVNAIPSPNEAPFVFNGAPIVNNVAPPMVNNEGPPSIINEAPVVVNKAKAPTVNNEAPLSVNNKAPMVEAPMVNNEAPLMINGTPLVINEPSDMGNVVVAQQLSPWGFGIDYDAAMDPAFEEFLSQFPPS